MPDSTEHQRNLSFSVDYLRTLADLSNSQMCVALRALVDDTPGMARTLALSVRDQAVQDLASSYGSATSANRVAIAYSRYLGTAWRLDCETGPDGGASAERVLLFKIAMANGGRSIGYHQIRNILLGQRGRRI
jgi:hypothetical protein